ncbi:MAG: hypothetical protein JJLCMIEE_02795 [Acidimicrobiales bacterium]|nr:MAG: hypothetical protein EDR02_18250 [Actinomycetota bacterium]MBV6509699.1 hypothetical protein [Acidimicrobiales bacterium]RIK02640.1 MAG: hypothetical protein DCC48_17775 [Acidobacteriota bacterium]
MPGNVWTPVRCAAVVALMCVTLPVGVGGEAQHALAASPSIQVSPAEDLVDGQAITITGEGFEPDAFIGLSRCVGEPSFETCLSIYGDGSFALSDEDGSFGTTWHAEPRYEIGDAFTGGPELVDCRRRDDCSIVAGYPPFLGGFVARADVDYDPSGELLPRPEVSVDPATGLVDRQIARFSADGIDVDYIPMAIQCASGALTIEDCDRSTLQIVEVVGGSASGSFLVESLLDLVDGRRIDCRNPLTPCALLVGGSYEVDEYGQAGLSFAPGGELAEPAITVTPSTGLVDAQSVSVRGERFHPGAPVGIAQCRAGATDTSRCGPVPHHQVSVDSYGRFTTEFRVGAVVRHFNQALDCTAGVCVIAASDGLMGGDFASYPISFGTGATKVGPGGTGRTSPADTVATPQATG